MNVVFRTDASSRIGAGHVMRCLTLGTALRERGACVSFISREHDGHLCDLVEERGFAVARLPGPTVRALLGATWQEDAAQVRPLLAAGRIDWLVVDHYSLDMRWERELRPHARGVLVIDDLADREHDCDALLDQNLVADMAFRYGGKLPKRCTALLGPEYALLQPQYAELHDRVPLRTGSVRRICISFGGADPDNLTGRALAALLSLGRLDLAVDVVIGPGSPHEASVHRQAAGRANIHLHVGVPTLAPLFARADLAIGAGGGTSWERLCVGLPALVVTLADNQRPVAAALSERGLIRWLGHHDAVDEAALAAALRDLLAQGLDAGWSKRCHAVLDGRGVERVCAFLAVTATSPLRVRSATPSDETMLLVWANDPVTRRNSFSPESISEDAHRAWFSERLQDVGGCRIYIIEAEHGVALGQVRFDLRDRVWEIDYSLAPAFRGRGLGTAILKAALQRFHAEKKAAAVVGRVHADNRASRKVFEALDFKIEPRSAQDHVVFSRELRPAEPVSFREK